MPFATENDVPDFGTIKMIYSGDKVYGYKNNVDSNGHYIDRRLRGYILASKDIAKLNLINNAADGSRAICADTSDLYLYCDGTWYLQ